MCDSIQPVLNLGTQFDTNDDSKNRMQAEATDSLSEENRKSQHTESTNAEVLQPSRSVMNNFSDESRCQNNSCPSSTDQHAQQLVTSVLQNRCIEPTVANSCGIDKCLATNKHELTKQHSTQTSNQWLSKTFSRFTSSVLGKTKNKTGEEFVGNINPNSNSNITIKPEFNFFL